MKKKNFLMLALAAVAFAACSNEDLVPVDNPGNNDDLVTDSNGEAWVALAVKTPVQTRGLKEPEKQEAATEDESKISKVRAIFFTADANEDDATVTADITLTNDQAGLDANGIPSGGAGKAFKVPATSKRILIIANPSTAFDAKTFNTTTTYALVNAALDDAVSTMTAAGKFMMSNAKGALEPSVTDDTDADFGKAKDLALYKTETAATSNPLSIRIDRVVAKVRVYVTETSDNSKVKIEDSGWVLNVTNKTYFPASKRTLTWNEDSNNSGRGTCITPFDQYKIGSYRIDPNYGNQPAGSYNFYDTSTDPTSIPWKLRSVKDGATEYCLENTQTQPNNMHAYTTQVLLKAKFVPQEYGRPAPNDGTPSKVQEATAGLEGDWMLINGGFYTPTTLMEWIAAELTAKYADKEPTTYPTARTTAYNRYLAAVGVGAITIPPTIDLGANPTALTDLIQEFEDTIADLVAISAQNRAKSVTGLNYYVNAVSYYKIMIKHDDTSAATNELGEFGVVRNSVYDINVKAFNNPGYPVIPDPDPNAPDETDDGWLSIEIITNPWTWYTQEEIL